MQSSRLRKAKKIEGNIIKSLRSLFRLKKINRRLITDVKNIFSPKKEIDNTTVKDIRNLFRLKREKKAIKGRVIRDIR